MSPISLHLQPATPDDIPLLTDLWYASFTDAGMRHIWPDTPGVRQWWNEANGHDMQHKPFQRYMTVVDENSKDDRGRPRIVAYAKWDLAMPDVRGARFPPWHPDQPAGDCDALFEGMEGSRRRVLGDEKNYYLDMLCTHPDYRGRGAGGMLVKWGCDLADADGVSAYVDASSTGKPLYEKFGFVDYSLPDSGGFATLARKKRS